MDTKIKKILNFAIIFFLPVLFTFIYSCSPSGILATGGGTAMVVAEGDRSIGSVVDAGNNLFININTTVLEGRVLLTGLVDNQEERIEAVRLVWEVNGIREVINEIEIGNRESIKDYANDLWINTQAKGMAAKTIGLRSVGYNFETIKGKIYIAGITSRPEQLEELVDVLKTIKGVKEIINYVIIKE